MLAGWYKGLKLLVMQRNIFVLLLNHWAGFAKLRYSSTESLKNAGGECWQIFRRQSEQDSFSEVFSLFDLGDVVGFGSCYQPISTNNSGLKAGLKIPPASLKAGGLCKQRFIALQISTCCPVKVGLAGLS